MVFCSLLLVVAKKKAWSCGTTALCTGPIEFESGEAAWPSAVGDSISTEGGEAVCCAAIDTASLAAARQCFRGDAEQPAPVHGAPAAGGSDGGQAEAQRTAVDHASTKGCGSRAAEQPAASAGASQASTAEQGCPGEAAAGSLVPLLHPAVLRNHADANSAARQSGDREEPPDLYVCPITQVGRPAHLGVARRVQRNLLPRTCW